MAYVKGQPVKRSPWRLPPGRIESRAGGDARAVDWTRLRRFLILGSAGGTYSAAEWKPTPANADAVERAVRSDGRRAVGEIVAVARGGRAPRNDPALFALALAAGIGDEETRKAALEALPQVARTATHLFRFASFVEGFRGWGRSLRRAVGRWYAAQPVDALAYQAVKYAGRDGRTHRDLLCLAHPAHEVGDDHHALFEWIVRGGETDGLPRLVDGFARAQAAATPQETAELVREYGLPREAVLPEHLKSAAVWDALLDGMPLTAVVRNLPTMTRVGLVAPGSAGAAKVVAQLRDADRIRGAGVHPIALLVALRTYASARGGRGLKTWAAVGEVVDALEAAFYTAFGNVEPAGKRLLLALDVSGSMAYREIAGAPCLTPRDASAALALVAVATEPHCDVVGFVAGPADGLTPLALSPGQRLDDAVETVANLPFGGTDCALPMRYAQALEREVDTFVIYTDSKTSAGEVHPADALRAYRRASGIDARLVVVGMASKGFSIADPTDPGMLDVVGFDAATPQLVSDFARGAV
jgi:60 kDa SS-A/Ro ribonucleoprotein